MNIIFVNHETFAACFAQMKKGRKRLEFAPSQIAENHVGCAGCHQPYLLIGTPLARRKKMLDALRAAELKKVAEDAHSQFASRSDGSTRYALGAPDVLYGKRYKVSSHLHESSIGSYVTPAQLDLTHYPKLALSCGRCHLLGASQMSLQLASIFIGLCSKADPDDHPCFGYDVNGWTQASEKKTIHEGFFGKDPFNGLEAEEVHAELRRAAQDCRHFHRQPKECARLAATLKN